MRESSQSLHDNVNTYFITIPGIARPVSRVALGTWAIGGWMWGGTDAARSIRAIHAAVDEGVSPSASPPAPTRSRRSALRCAAGTSRRWCWTRRPRRASST